MNLEPPSRTAYWRAVAAFTAGAVVFVFWRSWVCDDAFITFRHIDNCLAGHGPVFNIGERVQGFTHPLWFLILLAGSTLIDTYALAVAAGLACTAAIVLAIASYLRHEQHATILFCGLWLVLFSSPSFVEYQSSGLETSLTHVLVVVLWGWLLTWSDAGMSMRYAASGDAGTQTIAGARILSRTHTPGNPFPRHATSDTPSASHTHSEVPSLPGVVLLCSLLVLNRPDHVVICAPLLLWVFVHLVRRRRLRTWLGCLGAALPMLAWYAFATIYYGSPLPNTVYAKLCLPVDVARIKGLMYVWDYALYEPIHAALIGCALIAGALWSVGRVIRRERGAGLALCLATGLWLQFLYVISVGGDFMRGRFLVSTLAGSTLLAGHLFGRYVSSGRLGLLRWVPSFPKTFRMHPKSLKTDRLEAGPTRVSGRTLSDCSQASDATDSGIPRGLKPAALCGHTITNGHWAVAIILACYWNVGWFDGLSGFPLGLWSLWGETAPSVMRIVTVAGIGAIILWGMNRLARGSTRRRASQVFGLLALWHLLYVIAAIGRYDLAAPAVVFLAAALGIGSYLCGLAIAGRSLVPPAVPMLVVMLIAAASSLCDIGPRLALRADDSDITDEYAWYAGEWYANRFREPQPQLTPSGRYWGHVGDLLARYAADHGPLTIRLGALGLVSHHAGPRVHVVDQFGLTDAFVARLPGDPASRVGHIEHRVPGAYYELHGAINLLPDWRQRLEAQDPALAAEARSLMREARWSDPRDEELYRQVRTVISGEIFSRQRILTLPSYIMSLR